MKPINYILILVCFYLNNSLLCMLPLRDQAKILAQGKSKDGELEENFISKIASGLNTTQNTLKSNLYHHHPILTFEINKLELKTNNSFTEECLPDVLLKLNKQYKATLEIHEKKIILNFNRDMDIIYLKKKYSDANINNVNSVELIKIEHTKSPINLDIESDDLWVFNFEYIGYLSNKTMYIKAYYNPREESIRKIIHTEDPSTEVIEVIPVDSKKEKSKFRKCIVQ